jgi:cell division protein FtsB
LIIAGFFWVVITALAVVNDRGFLAMWRMHHETAQLAHEVQMIEQENRDLLQDARSLRFDMAHIERIAREELGLVRPGEIVFELVE